MIAKVVRSSASVTLPLAAPSAPAKAVPHRVIDTSPAY